MCFYPMDFTIWVIKGLKVGWHGLVPSKAQRMSKTTCDLRIDRLIYVDRIVYIMEGEELFWNLSICSIPQHVEAGVAYGVKTDLLE